MKTLVILNGECSNYNFLKRLALKCDKVICADGGYYHALKAGIVPDVVVGDFDSSSKPTDIATVVFPAEKDLNDAEIAVQYALDNFGDEVVFTCALGKRFDHQIFNLFLLLKYEKLSIAEESVDAFLCEDETDFSDYDGQAVSFLPAPNANITLCGFKYPLNNKDVKLGETLTLSNIAQRDAKLYVNSGRVIAVVSKTDI